MNERINFKPTTLNIFTDASVRNMNYGFDSASGFVAMIGDQKLAEQIQINRNTTNNFGEIYAIQMAVQLAFDVRRLMSEQPKYINIFSDSLISVKGLREWFDGWTLDDKGYLLNSSGEKVANQNIITSIINMIITYNIDVSFFHIKGHINFNKDSEVEKAMSKFDQHNGTVGIGKIDKETMIKMLECNDYVDNSTRESLQYSENIPILLRPIEKLSNFTIEEINKYKKLIDPRYHF